MLGQQGRASGSAIASSHSKSSEHLHGPPFVCVPLPPASNPTWGICSRSRAVWDECVGTCPTTTLRAGQYQL